MFDDETPTDWLVIKKELEGSTLLYAQLRTWYDNKNAAVFKYPERYTEWKIVDDKLLYHHPDPIKKLIGDEDTWKIILRDLETLEVMRANHESLDAAHLGRDKINERIKIRYYWPGLSQYVNSFIEECNECKQVKYKQSCAQAIHGQYVLLM